MNRPAADSRNMCAPWTGSWIGASKKFPPGVSFDQACFVEPVNTCLKGVKQIDPQPEDVVVDPGTGSHRPDLYHDGGAHRRAHRRHRHHGRAAARWRCSFGARSAFDPRDPEARTEPCPINDRRPRRGSGDHRGVGAGHRGAGGRVLAAGRADPAVRANLASGANRSFRRRHLYGRADFVRLLQRFGGSCRRNRRSWFSAAPCRWKS